MSENKNPVIALVTDYDLTLLPDSTTALLEFGGINTAQFWGHDVKTMIAAGWDPSLAYLERLVQQVGEGRPLGLMTNARLREFGATLAKTMYPGVRTLRRDLQAVASAIDPSITFEFYVVSGGIQEVLEGNPIIARNCAGIYGCQFEEDPETGLIRKLKRCITYTEKTRILFEISKGINHAETVANPYAVNRHMPKAHRPVPFQNMIYIGDGLTDIPCFSLMKATGGMAFGIFDPTSETSAQRALNEFVGPDRVISMHAARYRRNDELGSLLRAAVATIARRIAGGKAQTEPVRMTPAD